jgi:ASC-1-like (ASCH) protein
MSTKQTSKKTTKKSSKRSSKGSGSSKGSTKKEMSKFSVKDTIVVGMREPWMSLVKSGVKTVEGRLDYGIFSKIKEGNVITWKNSKDEVKTKVLRVTKYDTFSDMCYKEKYWKVIPGASSFKCALDVYHKIFKKQQESRYGVVALELEVLRD